MNMDTSHHLQQQQQQVQQQQQQQMMYAQLMANNMGNDPSKGLAMYQMANPAQMYLTPPPSYLAPPQQQQQITQAPTASSMHTIDDQIGNLDSCISELAAVAQQQANVQQQMSTDALYQQQVPPHYQSPNDSSQSPKESKSGKKTSNGSMKKSSSGGSGKAKSLLSTPSKSQSMHDSLSHSPANANKRRKKDPMAPKAPLNGYLVYFNEERVSMRQQNPNMSFGELTKVIAVKWKELAADEKTRYIAQAELNKERYVKEMDEYKQSDAYKQYLKENSAAKIKRNLSNHDAPAPPVPLPQQQQPMAPQQQQQHHMSSHHMMHPMQTMNGDQMMNGSGGGMYGHPQAPPQAHQMAYANHWAAKAHVMNGGSGAMGATSSSMAAQASSSVMASAIGGGAGANAYEMPIYSDEFVEHSKARENEMRQLRKEIGELEQQNSLLNKHIDTMKQSMHKIENECDQYKMSSEHYQKKLDVFRQTMLKCFGQMPLPNSPEYPTVATIDDYVFKLHNLVSAYQHDAVSESVSQNGADGSEVVVNGGDASASRAFVSSIKSIMTKFDLNGFVDC